MTALGAAAHGFASWLTRPGPTVVGQVTGVDHLGRLLRQHRQDLVRRLRLVDPSSAARRATPWQMITVITAGRVLTGVPG